MAVPSRRASAFPDRPTALRLANVAHPLSHGLEPHSRPFFLPRNRAANRVILRYHAPRDTTDEKKPFSREPASTSEGSLPRVLRLGVNAARLGLMSGCGIRTPVGAYLPDIGAVWRSYRDAAVGKMLRELRMTLGRRPLGSRRTSDAQNHDGACGSPSRSRPGRRLRPPDKATSAGSMTRRSSHNRRAGEGTD